LLVAAVAVAMVAVASGCGDDDEASAEDEVCDAWSDVRGALDDVVTDVQDANFGEASDDLSTAGDALDDLVTAVEELGQDQREALAPEVDTLQSDVAALQDAQDLEELSTGVDTVTSQAQVVIDDITDTMSCD
jgi:gas vesicle protein